MKWVKEAVLTPDITKPYAIKKNMPTIHGYRMNHLGMDRQNYAIRVAEEFINAANGKGFAISKKLAHHKVAEAQRQYANLYWSGKLVK